MATFPLLQVSNPQLTQWVSLHTIDDDEKTILIKAVGIFDRTVKELKKQIEDDKPKVEFAEQVGEAKNAISMGDMAKLVRDENIPIGRNKLFEWLRNSKILMKGNVPYQSQIEQNHFILKESVVYKGGMPDVVKTTYVTGKGQRFIVNKLKKEISQTYVPA